jgi:hypothetical protein
MDNHQMIAYFNIDRDSEHCRTWGERHVVQGTVGATLASATGGYVNNFGRAGASGRCFILFGVSKTAAALFTLSPDVFMETVFSEESQKRFGILDLTIKLRG